MFHSDLHNIIMKCGFLSFMQINCIQSIDWLDECFWSCVYMFMGFKIGRFWARWTSNYMVCDIYRAQNRLVFCVIFFCVVVGGFVIVWNCKFFAEIWAQGEFCDFWKVWPVPVILAEFCGVGVVCGCVNYFLLCEFYK